MFLYHATYQTNIQSIMREGLLPNTAHHNYDGMALTEGVFLALTPEAAMSYAECSDYYNQAEPAPEIVLLQIDTKKLDMQAFSYDYNNHCETSNDINSFVYDKTIPVDAFSVVNPNELWMNSSLLFEEIKHIDEDAAYLWEIIGSTFDEQVGWMYEHDEELTLEP